ncbi:MAG: di-trans,poly-cis-decaprenylcistransferase [Candidatus Marinimicrobia bacterium]|nr:di-trans,poly-cis-decaprenylcistransferase [Candidatus Neomarinimicrobiota bacterium]|tara:strand:+ start:7069 stop:7791 length:723 start_codon:yes stop_codon:yes gene_type:complete
MKKYPSHIAIIMDGNGRWAKLRNKPRIFGHKRGVERVRDIVKYCRNSSYINFLTLYTFSSENWMRPKLEINALMKLIKTTIIEQIDDLVSNGIQIRIIGDIESLPKFVHEKLVEAMELTKNNDKLVVNLAINYGARNEIINAVKIISKKIKNNEISIDDISEGLFNDNLYTSYSPYPDLLIRTGGESRLSNFLLWQLAYSEIIVNEKFWPEYKVEDLKLDINKFSIKERRFGKTSEQINY